MLRSLVIGEGASFGEKALLGIIVTSISLGVDTDIGDGAA